MNWTQLTTEEQLTTLLECSHTKPQLIFKHSTRCSISSVVKTRLESDKKPGDIDFHYLDLIAYRSLSNKIAEDFDVYHESPQVLLIQNGKCVFDESHLVIRMQDILSEVV
jgi:bacillithiol system protein YtxJ